MTVFEIISVALSVFAAIVSIWSLVYNYQINKMDFEIDPIKINGVEDGYVSSIEFSFINQSKQPISVHKALITQGTNKRKFHCRFRLESYETDFHHVKIDFVVDSKDMNIEFFTSRGNITITTNPNRLIRLRQKQEEEQRLKQLKK